MASILAFALYLTGFVSFFGIAGWQVLHYLKTGEWMPVSLITGLQYLDVPWAFVPMNWVGLHTILDHVHLGLGVFLLCSLLGAIFTGITEEY